MVEEIKEEYVEQKGSELWMAETIGEEIEGVVLDKFEGTYGMQYVIQTKDGEEVTTPSHKVLVTRMAKAKVGDGVKIKYVRDEAPTLKGNKPTRIYEVFLKVAK